MSEPFSDDSLIQQILDERVASKRMIGAALGMVDEAGDVRTFMAGTADNPSVILDRRTVFEIGSITKTFTAALLGQMVATGEVMLDDPIEKWLPSSVQAPRRNQRSITLLDLATHTSGLPRIPTNLEPTGPNPYRDYSAEELHEFLSSHVLERDIGTEYEYSNTGGGLLGHILATRAGISFDALLTERILNRLGMADTVTALRPELSARLAPGHDQAGSRVPTWEFGVLAPTGALRSTLDDMVTYLRANLDPGSSSLGAVLKMTHQARRSTGDPTMAIGLCWHRRTSAAGEIVWHNGGTAGYRSFIGFIPSQRRGLVLLTNSALDPDDIGWHLLDEGIPLTVARTEVTVADSILSRCPGTYQIAPDVCLIVTLEEDGLWVEVTGKGKVRLLAESEVDFFIREVDNQITFSVDIDGTVTGLVLRMPGQQFPANRVR